MQRVQVEQHVLEAGLGEHLALDPAAGAHEEWAHVGIQTDEGSRNGEPRVEVTTRPAAGEDDPHVAVTATGSVACAPTTFSRALPMFARMPVMRIESTRFVRP